MGGGASALVKKYKIAPSDEEKYRENFSIFSKTGMSDDIILEAMVKQYERDHPKLPAIEEKPVKPKEQSPAESPERRKSLTPPPSSRSSQKQIAPTSHSSPSSPQFSESQGGSSGGDVKESQDQKVPSYMNPLTRSSVTGDSPPPSINRRNSGGLITQSTTPKTQSLSRRGSVGSFSRLNSEDVLGGVRGSIEGKPFACAICEMYFPSKLMLDRHLELSFTHTRTIKDIEEAKRAKLLAEKKAEEEAALAAMEAVIPSTPRARNWWRKSIRWGLMQARIKLAKRKLAKRRIDILWKKLDNFQPAKMVFQGTKVYWKRVDKESIEYSFLVHDADASSADKAVEEFSQVLEIVGFDTKAHSELPRLHLNYAKLTTDLKEDIDKQIENFRNSTLFKTAGAGLSEEKVNEKITKEAIGKLLLPRIELESSSDPLLPRQHPYLSILEHVDADASVEVKDSLIKQDDSIKIVDFKPYLIPRPLILKYLVPGVIQRHRRMSRVEISEAFAEMRKEVSTLSEHTSKAETHAVSVDTTTPSPMSPPAPQ